MARPQQRYYNDKRWKVIREDAINKHPVCECCKIAWATHVHHIIQWAKYIKPNPEKAEKLCYNGHVACLCDSCHRKVHSVIDLSPSKLEIVLELMNEHDNDYRALQWQLNTPTTHPQPK